MVRFFELCIICRILHWRWVCGFFIRFPWFLGFIDIRIIAVNGSLSALRRLIFDRYLVFFGVYSLILSMKVTNQTLYDLRSFRRILLEISSNLESVTIVKDYQYYTDTSLVLMVFALWCLVGCEWCPCDLWCTFQMNEEETINNRQ